MVIVSSDDVGRMHACQSSAMFLLTSRVLFAGSSSSTPPLDMIPEVCVHVSELSDFVNGDGYFCGRKMCGRLAGFRAGSFVEVGCQFIDVHVEFRVFRECFVFVGRILMAFYPFRCDWTA